jgi:DNA (cytosine-5)-methyltransferase 1
MAQIDTFKDYSVVDLFCGVGGLTHGFIQEKFNVVAGVDFDISCKYAYEKNNNTKFIYQDITTIHSQDILNFFPNQNKKILVGCAPCQAFSIIFSQKKFF